jgi:photosystem II stability/assembly factor-like uncharacterized protein
MSPLSLGTRLCTRVGPHGLTRSTIVGLLAAFVLPAVGGAAGGYRYPRFQPVSIAFIDARHGVLAEDDWVCQKAHGCEGRILMTEDGGSRWRVTFTGARGVELFPVRGTQVVYALTGDAMLKSTDAGLHWRRLGWRPALVSFVTPAHGWRLGRATTLAHPPQLYETRDGGRSWITRVDPCKGDYGVPAALSFASKTRGWIVCNTQATAGYQGKAVWMTTDGGTSWELRGRTHPIGPPEPKQQVGNLPGYGYPTDATFLADGHGWVLQGRGDMLITADGGHTWQHSPLTKPDTIAAQSADLLSDRLGFVLLRGCTVRLVRTNLTTTAATTLKRWNSPTQC